MALAVDGNDPIVVRNKMVWTRLALWRAGSIGNPVASLEWDRNFNIDWRSQGYYSLVCEGGGASIDAANATGEVTIRYTHIRFRGEVQASPGARMCDVWSDETPKCRRRELHASSSLVR